MTPEQVRLRFRQLAECHKVRAVSVLAHNLTVAARGCCLDAGDPSDAVRKLRGFNELMHTVSGKLIALSSSDPSGFPDEGFLDVLFEKAQRADCEPDLLAAFAWTFQASE